MTDTNDDAFKLTRSFISKGALTPRLLADLKKRDHLKRQINNKRLEIENLDELVNLDTFKAGLRLEAARDLAVKKGIDEDFPLDEEMLRNIDIVVDKAVKRKLQRVA